MYRHLGGMSIVFPKKIQEKGNLIMEIEENEIDEVLRTRLKNLKYTKLSKAEDVLREIVSTWLQLEFKVASDASNFR